MTGVLHPVPEDSIFVITMFSRFESDTKTFLLADYTKILRIKNLFIYLIF